MAKNRWVPLLTKVARSAVSAYQQSRSSGAATSPTPRTRPQGAAAYAGDYTGPLQPRYAPRLDGDPDPGEVVWTWVPYEDDPTRGKDRPVLLVGHDGPWLLGLQLTSKDHDRDADQEARYGRQWMDVGTGAWDAQGRPSEVRLNRVIRVTPGAVRREGAVMEHEVFERVVAAMARARR